MITKDELQELFASTETYRIERTVSTTDKDKFGEAVCAFANDMPDSGKPGYLLVGVRNDGSLNGLKASDELLQKFAALRSDGNILPIPSIAVDSFSFPDGDMIVVEVLPSDQPPVRYRGRTWIRIGPRRDIASPAEEAMKVLGYVNCYNRGINMVQDELVANGNGKAEFSFRLITAFEAKVALAGNGLGDKLPESGTMDGTLALRIVSVIEKEPSVTMDQLSEKLSVARRTLVRYMNILQENNRIKRVGGKRFGHWEVVE